MSLKAVLAFYLGSNVLIGSHRHMYIFITIIISVGGILTERTERTEAASVLFVFLPKRTQKC